MDRNLSIVLSTVSMLTGRCYPMLSSSYCTERRQQQQQQQQQQKIRT